MIGPWTTAVETADLVRSGTVSALEVARAAVARIEAGNPRLNAFTEVLAERALGEARAVDEARAAGRELPPLAGVPYAVKNLFDLAGISTLAGSRIERDTPPAARDAFLVERLACRRCRLPRRPQHGRVRLRLHDRERPLRARPQPARPRALGGRLLGRLLGRGGGRARPADPRERYQRLDPRALLAHRHLRPQAHLRPPLAQPHLPVRREPRPSGSLRPQHGRPCPRL